MLDVYLLQVFNGLSVGSILLLVALGLAFSFGLMGVINMVHGELIMIGAYMPYVLQQLVGGAANDPLGLTFLVRIDSVLLLGPLALYLLVRRAHHDLPWRRAAPFLVPLLAMLLHAGLHAALFSRKYLVNVTSRPYWSQPPWVLAQKIISGGTSHSTRAFRSARRSSSTRTEKQSTENSCGRTCCARVRIPTRPRAVSTTAVRASAPSSFAILHTQVIDRRMIASLSSTRPLEPAILNAAAITISDSHS